MKASFIILNYNRKEELLLTIAKTKELIKTLASELEIIAVDNGSSDGSAAAVKESFPNITLVESKENIGISGRNLGFEVAKGDYFILLDNDSHIESGLPEALKYLDANPKVGILALNVTTGPYQTKDFNWNKNEDVLGFFACGAIIRKELYEKIGGFAEWIMVYADEFEYGVRCLEAGYVMRYFEDSNVIHRTSAVNRSFKRTRILSTRNEMGIAYKYFDNRWKYILIMFANNLKRITMLGVKSSYYDILGTIEFLKMRKTLSYTPVRKDVQDFFVKNYLNTYPVFGYFTKKYNKLINKKALG